MSLKLPTHIHDRYELLADELDGFEGADELARYVLEATASEIDRDSTDGRGDGVPTADDEVVADRLEQLGYLEK